MTLDHASVGLVLACTSSPPTEPAEKGSGRGSDALPPGRHRLHPLIHLKGLRIAVVQDGR